MDALDIREENIGQIGQKTVNSFLLRGMEMADFMDLYPSPTKDQMADNQPIQNTEYRITTMNTMYQLDYRKNDFSCGPQQ